jgi:hypothetical protein
LKYFILILIITLKIFGIEQGYFCVSYYPLKYQLHIIRSVDYKFNKQCFHFSINSEKNGNFQMHARLCKNCLYIHEFYDIAKAVEVQRMHVM